MQTDDANKMCACNHVARYVLPICLLFLTIRCKSLRAKIGAPERVRGLSTTSTTQLSYASKSVAFWPYVHMHTIVSRSYATLQLKRTR